MSGLLRFLAIAALAILIVGFYVLYRMLDLSGGVVAPVPTATYAAMVDGLAKRLPDLLEVRLHYCSASRTYTLLSIPRDASFQMLAIQARPALTPIPVTGGTGRTTLTARNAAQSPSSMPGADACAEVGIVDERKLVLCRGQGPAHFNLSVTNAQGTRVYSVALTPCMGAKLLVTP